MTRIETRLHFVDGEWTESESGVTFETHNPASPADTIATYPQGGGSETDAAEAVKAA